MGEAEPSLLVVGDVFRKRYPGMTAEWTVVAVELERVRLKAKANGHRFWLDRATIDNYWMADRVQREARP